jgi:malate synthase
MEDAATAEISRSQVWQWIRHGAKMKDGRVVTADLVRKTIADELAKMRKNIGDERYGKSQFDRAGKLFEEMMTKPEFTEFLTLVAYDNID